MSHIVAPMTFGQLSLWRSEELTPMADRPEWHLVRAWEILRGATLVSVQAALDTMTENHESLHTVFDLSKPVPDQWVMPMSPVLLQVVHQPSCSAGEALDIAKRLAAQPFDLAREFGWRVAVVITEQERPAYLCLAFHHMTADAWSINLLKSEWRRLNGDPDAEAAVGDRWQPRQLAELQQSTKWIARQAAAVKYWRGLLARFPAPPSADGEMSYNRKTERLQGTLSSTTLGTALHRIATKHAITPPSAVLAVTLASLAEFEVPFTEPLLLMASNRFDPHWQGLVSTMNQAALLDIPPVTDDFADFAKAVEWASRVAYRHGCYDIDEFTRVTTEVRGAPLGYDFFFNYASNRLGTATGEWTGTADMDIRIGEAPQQTGPQLEIRIVGFEQLKIDIRADSELLSAETLAKLVERIGLQAHALAQ